MPEHVELVAGVLVGIVAFSGLVQLALAELVVVPPPAVDFPRVQAVHSVVSVALEAEQLSPYVPGPGAGTEEIVSYPSQQLDEEKRQKRTLASNALSRAWATRCSFW